MIGKSKNYNSMNYPLNDKNRHLTSPIHRTGQITPLTCSRVVLILRGVNLVIQLAKKIIKISRLQLSATSLPSSLFFCLLPLRSLSLYLWTEQARGRWTNSLHRLAMATTSILQLVWLPPWSWWRWRSPSSTVEDAAPNIHAGGSDCRACWRRRWRRSLLERRHWWWSLLEEAAEVREAH